MLESFSSDESDEDELPSLPDGFEIPQYVARTNEKPFGELVCEAIDLKNIIISKKEKSDKSRCLDEALPQEVVLRASPAYSLEENEEPADVCLFGQLGTLQYFNMDGLGLWRCGYYCIPSEELSKVEKLLLSWSEEELLGAIGQTVKGISIDDVPNLNPIMHYILKLVSIHVDIATVNCCAQFIKKILSQHLDVASISFSSAEVFMILFNYGVDIENSEIFQMFPSIKAVEVNLSCARKLPVQWKYNLRIVLNCLADIFQYCKFNKDDLCNILLYLLWMSVDRTLKASFIYQELQTCLCNVILSFTDQLWPICLSHISQTLMSGGSLPVSKQWSYVLDMTRAIPYIICRGVQLRKQICFVALRHLSENVPGDSPFGYPDESYVISELQDILESICLSQLNLQNIAVGFLGIFVMHLKLTSDENCSTLCKSVKIYESAVRSYDQVSSMYLQHQLMRIYSTLSMSSHKRQKFLVPVEDISDEGDSDNDRVADEKSQIGDERVECIVENNTEYAYPFVLPPMTIPSQDDSLVSVSKRESKASGYLSDVEGIGDKVASSFDSMDDRLLSSSECSMDDSDLSEYKSTPKLPSAHLKDIPSHVVPTSHSENKLDNSVSHLSSSNFHLQGQNSLPGNDSQGKAFLENNDASNWSMNKHLPAASGMEVSSLDSCSEMCTFETFCETAVEDHNLKMLLSGVDNKESNTKDIARDGCIRSSETICTANPTDNFMFISSYQEAPTFLNMSKNDELLTTKPRNDIQDKILIESNDALTVKISSMDKYLPVPSEMETNSLDSCSETGSFDTFCDASIREINRKVSLLHAEDKEESNFTNIASDVCIGSSEMICTANPTDNSMLVSSGIEAANLSVSKDDELPISSLNSNQMGHASSEDLSIQTQKYIGTVDAPKPTILNDPAFKTAYFTDEFLSCLSQMTQKKQTAKTEENSNSSQSDSAKVEKKLNSNDISISVISTEKKVSGNSIVIMSEGNEMSMSAEMEENSNLSQSYSENLEEESSDSLSIISTAKKVSYVKENLSPLPVGYKTDFIASNLSVYISPFCQQQSKTDFIASNLIVHISGFCQHSLETERTSSDNQSQVPTFSDFIQDDKVSVAGFASTQSICVNSLESLDSDVSTKELETITCDEFNRAVPGTSDEHQMINEGCPSSERISDDNSSLQDTCILQNMEFPSEATDNTHRILVQNTSHGTSSKEQITKVIKEIEEVLKQQLPPENLNDNYVPTRDINLNGNVAELPVMERENIQPSVVKKCPRKFLDEINSVKRLKKYDTIASVNDAKMDIVSNSITSEIRLPCKTENCYRIDESLSSDEHTSILSIISNKNGGNSYNVESADKVIEAESEFLPKEPIENVLQVVPPSIQEGSCQLFYSKRSTSVPEMQDNSSTDSSNVPTTSAFHFNELEARMVSCLEKDSSSPKLTNAAISEHNSLATSAHLLTEGSNTSKGRKPVIRFISEEEGCFTSSFAVPHVENIVTSNFNFLTGSSFKENINSVESEETNAEKSAIPHLNVEETHSSDDDIEIIDFVIHNKDSENGAIKSAYLETKRLSTLPSHSNAYSGSNRSSWDSMPTCLESSTTLPKELSTCPVITKHSTGPFTLQYTQVNDAVSSEPTTPSAPDPSVKIITLTKKVPPVQMVRDPGFFRIQPTITQYLSPRKQSPISHLNPSEQRSSTPVLDNRSRSFTPRSRLNSKRSFTPSPSTSSIDPFLVAKDVSSSNSWKRQLFNGTHSMTVEGRSATTPHTITTSPSTVSVTPADDAISELTTPSVPSIHAVPGISQECTYPKQDNLLNDVPQNSDRPQGSGSKTCGNKRGDVSRLSKESNSSNGKSPTRSADAPVHNVVLLYQHDGFNTKSKARTQKRLLGEVELIKKEKPSPAKKLRLSETNGSRTSTTVILPLSDDSDIEVLSDNIDDDCVIVSEALKKIDIITIDQD